MSINLFEALKVFLLLLGIFTGCAIVAMFLEYLEERFNKVVATIIAFIGLFVFCIFITGIPAGATELHNYEVYYPNSCTFMNGSYEVTHASAYVYNYYQVVCKEGGDISTYVSAPIKEWKTPARVNHIPSNIRGYIYVKKID